jgi:hypothetical protein
MTIELDWSTTGALVAAFGGLVGYGIKKYGDVQGNHVVPRHLEIMQQLHERKFAALDRVMSSLGAMKHSIDHIMQGDQTYTTRCQKLCMELRRCIRADIAVLGPEYVQQVEEATASALAYSEEPKEENHRAWLARLTTLQGETLHRIKHRVPWLTANEH